jgi:nitroimidazol reductase NimA-like FMN-containing flavoprotein (pyridoxamine 5'-phosphate oxidase superfamily)
MRALVEDNLPVCISVTLLDGLVLARSAFHHSMNYRSVVLFSHAEKVTDTDEMYKALEVFTNKVQPGRWNDVRVPTPGEWKSTLLISFTIEEASAKIRTGPPKDDDADYSLDIWAGVIPLKTERQDPVPDQSLKPGIILPPYLV